MNGLISLLAGSQGRARAKPAQLLSQILHADGYAGFANLYQPDPKTGEPKLIEVACWAHARRKIYDVHVATASPAAHEALEMIARLFAIEADIRGKSPTERRDARQENRRRSPRD